jgi:hypothetical protein
MTLSPYGSLIRKILIKHKKIVFGSWVAYAATSDVLGKPSEQQKALEDSYYSGAVTIMAIMMEHADRDQKKMSPEEVAEDQEAFAAVMDELTKFATKRMLERVKPEGKA